MKAVVRPVKDLDKGKSRLEQKGKYWDDEKTVATWVSSCRYSSKLTSYRTTPLVGHVKGGTDNSANSSFTFCNDSSDEGSDNWQFGKFSKRSQKKFNDEAFDADVLLRRKGIEAVFNQSVAFSSLVKETNKKFAIEKPTLSQGSETESCSTVHEEKTNKDDLKKEKVYLQRIYKNGAFILQNSVLYTPCNPDDYLKSLASVSEHIENLKDPNIDDEIHVLDVLESA